MSEPLVNIAELLKEQTEQEYQILPFVGEFDLHEGVLQSGLEEIVRAAHWEGNVAYVTNGAWNMHDLLSGLARGVKHGSKVYISSYAINETSARTMALLKEEHVIKNLYCILDNRSDVRAAESLQLLRSVCDFICLAPCHAKVTVIDGDGGGFVIIGSANYTENKRYETGIISNNPSLIQFHKEWIIKSFSKHGKFEP